MYTHLFSFLKIVSHICTHLCKIFTQISFLKILSHLKYSVHVWLKNTIHVHTNIEL